MIRKLLNKDMDEFWVFPRKSLQNYHTKSQMLLMNISLSKQNLQFLDLMISQRLYFPLIKTSFKTLLIINFQIPFAGILDTSRKYYQDIAKQGRLVSKKIGQKFSNDGKSSLLRLEVVSETKSAL